MAELGANPAFWVSLSRPDIADIVFTLPPASQSAPVTEDYLDDIARAFAAVIDAKSPFTAGYGARITNGWMAKVTPMGCGAIKSALKRAF